MARNERESAYPTLWQLEALKAAHDAQTWEEVTTQLEVEKHQVLRTVARLETKLGIGRGLLLDRENAPYVQEPLLRLVDDARAILTTWQVMQEHARESERTYFVRINGYWSHIEHFAGAVMTTFEPSSRAAVRFELAPRFGSKRDQGGAGMVSELLPPNPAVDAVIAPDDDPNDPDGLTSMFLYRWALIAAVDRDHPLQSEVEDGVLDVRHLTKYPLAASPTRHRTRDLLDLYQSSIRRFEVQRVSPEPNALLAMGHGSRLVPVIASDSTLALGPWLGRRALKPTSPVGLPTWWPAIGTSEGVLGGTYRLYWRTEDSPKGLPELIEQFASQLQASAVHLDERAAAWWERLKPDGRP